MSLELDCDQVNVNVVNLSFSFNGKLKNVHFTDRHYNWQALEMKINEKRTLWKLSP